MKCECGAEIRLIKKELSQLDKKNNTYSAISFCESCFKDEYEFFSSLINGFESFCDIKK